MFQRAYRRIFDCASRILALISTAQNNQSGVLLSRANGSVGRPLPSVNWLLQQPRAHVETPDKSRSPVGTMRATTERDAQATFRWTQQCGAPGRRPQHRCLARQLQMHSNL